MKKYFQSLVFLAVLSILGCSNIAENNEPVKDTQYDDVPKHFPKIPFPDNNPYSREKFELGRMLFYEPKLSPDGSIVSCSHCMKQENNFGDNSPTSIGFSDFSQVRNVMNLTNSAYRKFKFWDGRGQRIEQPAYRSFFLLSVFGSDTLIINERLQNDEKYASMFEDAFGKNTVPSTYLAAQAISTFVRCFISGNSPYDRYVNGDKSAMSDDAVKGMDIFTSDRGNCSKCHSDFLFTDEKFHNTGVMTHYFDFGRYYVTNVNSDRGKFLTPSLRNCEVSAPYMHSGELETLEEVIEHYNRGGRHFINKDTLMKPLNLTFEEKHQLIEFLKSLTDREFLTNKAFANPFKN